MVVEQFSKKENRMLKFVNENIKKFEKCFYMALPMHRKLGASFGRQKVICLHLFNVSFESNIGSQHQCALSFAYGTKITSIGWPLASWWNCMSVVQL